MISSRRRSILILLWVSFGVASTSFCGFGDKRGLPERPAPGSEIGIWSKWIRQAFGSEVEYLVKIGQKEEPLGYFGPNHQASKGASALFHPAIVDAAIGAVSSTSHSLLFRVDSITTVIPQELRDIPRHEFQGGAAWLTDSVVTLQNGKTKKAHTYVEMLDIKGMRFLIWITFT
jgi:hypothetical protein